MQLNTYLTKQKKQLICIRNVMLRDRMAVVPNLKLFDACVKPIILYCAEIWSPYTLIRDEKAIETSFNSFIPEKIHNQFLKMVLGVHRSSTNSAVLAELGRYPLYIYQP